MYRLSDELAKLVMSKIRPSEIESSGSKAFLPKSLNSIGILDPVCCVGSQFHYILESPVPVIYLDIPFTPVGVQGYFLYRKEELMQPQEEWLINEALVNPMAKDYVTQINVNDCSILVASDIDKLTIPVRRQLNTLEELIAKEPLILDCLHI